MRSAPPLEKAFVPERSPRSPASRRGSTTLRRDGVRALREARLPDARQRRGLALHGRPADRATTALAPRRSRRPRVDRSPSPKGVAPADAAVLRPRGAEGQPRPRSPASSKSAFAALNTALFSGDGVVVEIEPGAVVAESRSRSSTTAASRDGAGRPPIPGVLVLAGERAEASIVETLRGPAARSFTERRHRDRARRRRQLEHTQAPATSDGRTRHVDTLAVAPGARQPLHLAQRRPRRRARADRARRSTLAGEGAECALYGLFVGRRPAARRQPHHHRPRDAARARAASSTRASSTAPPAASSTARSSCGPTRRRPTPTRRTRTCSSRARRSSTRRPQLEIFADDVKCTHGSTTGQLDEEALFYLRSRGIGEAEAQALLTYAFAADVVERIRVPGRAAPRSKRELGLRLRGAAGRRA